VRRRSAERDQAFIDYVGRVGVVDSIEAQAHLGYARTGTLHMLARLTAAGKLQRHGSRRGYRYTLPGRRPESINDRNVGAHLQSLLTHFGGK
jgi:hypothetical protein